MVLCSILIKDAAHIREGVFYDGFGLPLSVDRGSNNLSPFGFIFIRVSSRLVYIILAFSVTCSLAA